MFYRTFFLLRGHIIICQYWSHIYEMPQLNRLLLTQICLYRFYIPDLIWLTNDVETNPGTGIVDPTKAIATPYCPGNVEVFGTANAGTQCVAMSLSALVLNFRNPITSWADLVQVMNIGNNMYSALSQSCKQGLLLLTDLPVMVNLSDKLPVDIQWKL